MFQHHGLILSALLIPLVAVACPSSGDLTAVSVDTCASGLRWDKGDEESELMHPGGDCIGCHNARGEGPTFTAAGTVYEVDHQADDCAGVSGASVVITGADGVVQTLTTNEAGNFFTRSAIALPFTAKVVMGGAERAMLTPQASGACATCHTRQGANAAPGRVLTPGLP